MFTCPHTTLPLISLLEVYVTHFISNAVVSAPPTTKSANEHDLEPVPSTPDPQPTFLIDIFILSSYRLIGR
jgi:hypothetical protein